ncbi:MAG: hypothetical protein WA784_17475 [Albidovulum sp.]
MSAGLRYSEDLESDRVVDADFQNRLHPIPTLPKIPWLLKRKPESYPYGEFSDYAKKLAAEGYEVEAFVRELIESDADADQFSYQTVFQSLFESLRHYQNTIPDQKNNLGWLH